MVNNLAIGQETSPPNISTHREQPNADKFSRDIVSQQINNQIVISFLIDGHVSSTRDNPSKYFFIAGDSGSTCKCAEGCPRVKDVKPVSLFLDQAG